MNVLASEGNDYIYVSGGPGADTLRVDGGRAGTSPRPYGRIEMNTHHLFSGVFIVIVLLALVALGVAFEDARLILGLEQAA